MPAALARDCHRRLTMRRLAAGGARGGVGEIRVHEKPRRGQETPELDAADARADNLSRARRGIKSAPRQTTDGELRKRSAMNFVYLPNLLVSPSRAVWARI